MSDKAGIRIGNRVYEPEGKFLVCSDAGTREQCFRKTFSHPQYETLRDLDIREAHITPDGKNILLLFDLADHGYKTVGNLACVTPSGEVMWWAELTDTGWDNYVAVETDRDRIEAQTWSGYSCEIEPQTGRIVSKCFVK